MDIVDTVGQGGVNGPIITACQTDTIGKEQILREKHVYQYKNEVKVPCLTMIDDCIDFSECGTESIVDNTFIVSQIESKKLALNSDKCYKMHVGKCEI